MDAFEKHEHLAVRKEHFQLSIPTIANPNGKAVDYNLNDLVWTEVKFLKDDGSLHDEMGTIPNSGGLYIFRVKSDLLPGVVNFTMYIGRALNTDTTYSLKTRTRSYLKDKRISIRKMINYWGPYLYLSYTTLSDNQLIEDLEKYLIASILPVYNPDIDDVEIREPKRMFFP